MNECEHEYQPRYNREWSTPQNDHAKSEKKSSLGGDNIFVPYLKHEVYIHDICVKCGDVRGKRNE